MLHSLNHAAVIGHWVACLGWRHRDQLTCVVLEGDLLGKV